MKKRRRPILAIINKIQDQFILKNSYRKVWIKLIKKFLPNFYEKENIRKVKHLNNFGFIVLEPIKKEVIKNIREIAEKNYLSWEINKNR